MNGAHLHLLVNHLPVFGVSFGLCALLWGMMRKSPDMRWASILLFIFAGITSWVAIQSGNSAEQLVEHMPGVTESFIHAHEEAADLANIFASITAVAALVFAAILLKKQQILKIGQFVLLVLSAVTSVLMFKTANLGGQVRHTEIRSDSSGATPEAGEKVSPVEAQEGGDSDEK